MLEKSTVLRMVRDGALESGCIDGRDFSRLADFFPVSDWEVFGFFLKEDATVPEVKEWTEEAIRSQLRSDVAFGFEKAIGQRAISAHAMHSVVLMWLRILEDPIVTSPPQYGQYGLPLLKAVAIKYGFENPIGEDTGSEAQYASD